MNFFLKLKHWQLFVLVIGMPVIVQMISIIRFAFVSFDPTAMFTGWTLSIIFLAIFLIMGVFYGWLYTLGVNLNKKLPGTVKMNLTTFRWFVFIPVVYMICYCIFMFTVLIHLFESGEPDVSVIFASLGIIIPLHLFAIFCVIYCLNFVAKSLKAVEWQRPVTFSDYAGEFFLIWFFPIGIWFIQPRINKMFDKALQE